jgi:hypothetical protein
VWVEEEGGPHDVRVQPGSASTAGSRSAALPPSAATSHAAAPQDSTPRQTLQAPVQTPEEEEEDQAEHAPAAPASSSSGSATEIAPGQQFTSWTWRGGLSKARLKDRKTYE